jgi:hypothetical protein
LAFEGFSANCYGKYVPKMPIPQTPEFDEILGRLALVSNPGDQIAAAKELSIRPALDSTGELKPNPKIDFS